MRPLLKQRLHLLYRMYYSLCRSIEFYLFYLHNHKNLHQIHKLCLYILLLLPYKDLYYFYLGTILYERSICLLYRIYKGFHYCSCHKCKYQFHKKRN
nr:MAG TPA_asm: hypothetical protein [Caudoviricetes sp.]